MKGKHIEEPLIFNEGWFKILFKTSDMQKVI